MSKLQEFALDHYGEWLEDDAIDLRFNEIVTLLQSLDAPDEFLENLSKAYLEHSLKLTSLLRFIQQMESLDELNIADFILVQTVNLFGDTYINQSIYEQVAHNMVDLTQEEHAGKIINQIIQLWEQEKLNYSPADDVKKVRNALLTCVNSALENKVANGRDFVKWDSSDFLNISSAELRRKIISYFRRYVTKNSFEDSKYSDVYDHRIVELLNTAPSKLTGVKGYIFVANFFFGGNMPKAYSNMSSICKAAGLEFSILDWGNQYQGSSTEYIQWIKNITDNWPTLTSYTLTQGTKFNLYAGAKGIHGYISFAEKFFKGDMQKAYINMSAICKAAGLEFSDLDWGNQYQGSSTEYIQWINDVQNNWSTLTSSTLTQGTEFNLYAGAKGIHGYISFAEKFFKSDMMKAYKNMSAICNTAGLEFSELDWGNAYMGSASEYIQWINDVQNNWSTLTSSTLTQGTKFNLHAGAKGIYGYISFAEKFFKSDMMKAYMNMSAICNTAGLEFSELDWGNQYQGSASEYIQWINDVQNNWSTLTSYTLTQGTKFNLHAGAKGIYGYITFAEKFFKSDMKKAYINMSAICKAAALKFSELDWGNQYQGSASEYIQWINDVQNNWSTLTSYTLTQGTKFNLYAGAKGIHGYISFAEKFFKGDMQKAYINMSAICKAAGLEFSDLDWGNQFHGSSTEYIQWINDVQNNWSTLTSSTLTQGTEFNLYAGAKGIHGYITFAEKFFKSDMMKAYMNMSAICNTAGLEFSDLDWGSCYKGSSTEYIQWIDYIQNNWSTLTSSTLTQGTKFNLYAGAKGIHGYISFAEKFFKGDMQKAYINMSAICKAAGFEFSDLDWGSCYKGYAKDYLESL